MKVLILGADGQLGRCLQDQYRGSGTEVIAASRRDLDIVDRNAVLSFFQRYQPAIAFNCAAYTAVDKAELDEAKAYAVNAEGVINLAHAADHVGAKLVHISTDYVFDGTKGLAYEESDPVCPLGVYGQSKLAGEKAAARAAKHYIVRVGWLFSEYGNNFLKTMLRLAEGKSELSIVADQIGTPTYAGDLAKGLKILVNSKAPFGTYHFNGGRVCSWFDFAQEIFRQAKNILPTFVSPNLKPITSSEYPTAAKRPPFSVLDSTKLFDWIGNEIGDWEKILPRVVKKAMSG